MATVLALMMTLLVVAPAQAAFMAGDPSAIAAALSAEPGLVTGASYVTTPSSGTPNGVWDSALAAFPTHGGTFGIMTPGDASLAGNAQNSGASAGLGGPSVRGNSDFDVSILKIDITVPSGSNCLGFDFQFFTNEGPGTFNDAFIAELDSSTWTTSNSAITAPNNFAKDSSGGVISVNSTGATDMTPTAAASTVYSQGTNLLRATTPVTPGPHSLYLTMFDQGDSIVDSAVFLDGMFTSDQPETCTAGAGLPPITTSKVAHSPSSDPGAQNGYSITFTNPGSVDVTLDSIVDSLPSGFAYVPGSASGATTDDPTDASGTLTWAGPFVVPAAGAGPGTLTLTFDVTVAGAPGTYLNDATGTSPQATVIPADDAAEVIVTGGADNDDRANARFLFDASGSDNSENAAATEEEGEPEHGSGGGSGSGAGHSVWWSLIPPFSGTYHIESSGTDGEAFETVLGVYETTDSGLVPATGTFLCPDGCLYDTFFLEANAGQQYYIAIDSYDSDGFDCDGTGCRTGSVHLQWGIIPPDNDDFVGAFPMPQPTVSGGSASTLGTNAGATEEPLEPDHAGNSGGASVWYDFVGSGQPVVIDTIGSSALPGSIEDTVLGVYTGDAVGALTEVASNDDAVGFGLDSCVTFLAESDVTYSVAVDGYNMRQGDFRIRMSDADACEDLTEAPPPPDNDDLEFAFPLPAPDSNGSITVLGTNVSATSQTGEPAHAGNGPHSSVWYSFAPTSDGDATTTDPNDFVVRANGIELYDTLLAVYSGDTFATFETKAFNDDSGEGLNSCVTLTDVALDAPDAPLKIAVDGYGGQTGSFELTVQPGTTCGDPAAVEDTGNGDTTQVDAAPNQPVSTDETGDGATAEDPVETTVRAPEAGRIEITETNTIDQTSPDPSRYRFFGQQVNISAPPGKPDDPIQIVFRLDSSIIPAGEDKDSIAMFRNGTLVAECTGPAGIASPDPCVSKRFEHADGDIEITVLTSAASSWNAGARPPRQVGGGGGAGDLPLERPSPSPSASPTATPSPDASPSEDTSQAPSPDPETTAEPSPDATAIVTQAPTDSTPPNAEGSADTDRISPNGDGRSDTMIVTASFSEDVDWRFSVLPSSGARQPAEAAFTVTGRGREFAIRYNGQGDAEPLPDGDYRWQLTATDAAGNSATPLSGIVRIDTSKPVIESVQVKPSRLDQKHRKARIEVEAAGVKRVRATVLRNGRVVRELGSSTESAPTFTWSGRNAKGKRARPGNYTIRIKAYDGVGNRRTDKSTTVAIRRRAKSAA